MLKYETRAARRFDRVVAMTPNDAEFIRGCAPRSDVRDIPIGVDSRHYRPSDIDPNGPLRVVFLGNFRHTPNIEAARFLRDNVAGHFPDLRFEVAGTNLPEGLLDGSTVEATGYRPDTRSLYRRPNTIVAAPLFSGRGQRVKLLEAFSMGMPVVTTSLGAAGFPVRHGAGSVHCEYGRRVSFFACPASRISRIARESGNECASNDCGAIRLGCSGRSVSRCRRAWVGSANVGGPESLNIEHVGTVYDRPNQVRIMTAQISETVTVGAVIVQS